MRRTTSRGTSFGLRFMYRGERFYVHLGGEWALAAAYTLLSFAVAALLVVAAGCTLVLALAIHLLRTSSARQP